MELWLDHGAASRGRAYANNSRGVPMQLCPVCQARGFGQLGRYSVPARRGRMAGTSINWRGGLLNNKPKIRSASSVHSRACPFLF